MPGALDRNQGEGAKRINMKTKHTHGNWEIIEKKNGMFSKKMQIAIKNFHPYPDKKTGSSDLIICDIRKSYLKGYDERPEANAKLIAAAPDLLNALIELKKDIQADKYNYRLGTMNKVDEAIKKATE